MEAVRITDRLLKYIKLHNEATLQIHSVFDNSFNLIDDSGQIIGILSSGKMLSPMSMAINVHHINHGAIEQGHLCEIRDNALHIHNTKLKIQVEKAQKLNLKLDKWAPDILIDNLDDVKDAVIKNSQTGLGELIKYLVFDSGNIYINSEDSEINEYSAFIKERLVDLLNSIYHEQYDTFQSMVPRIIGFGPGLTPSTDDFVTGLISVLYVYDYRLAYDLIASSVKGKTTKISEEMIRHVSEGFVTEPYKILFAKLKSNKNQVEKALHQVIETGASSGVDYLFGVYCMLRIHLEKVKEAKT
jgi:hypothetical protein